MTEVTYPGEESCDSNEEDDYFSFDEDDQEVLTDPDNIDLSELLGSLDCLDDLNCADSFCR